MKGSSRNTDEIIVLALCALCMMGLSLFAVIRFLRGDLEVMLIDAGGALLTTGLFVHVYRSRNLSFAGPALALLSLTGSLALIAVSGAQERYLLYPTTVVAFFLMSPRWALIASVAAMLIAAVMMLPELEVFTLGKFLLSLSGCFLFAYIFARERNRQRDELLSLTSLDALTGIGNRRAFDAVVDEQIRIYRRAQATVSLLLMDVDNFKQVNDQLGHDAGDRLLKQIADLIAARMRAGDHAFRFGGDEFALVARGEGVLHLAEDLCTRVEELAQAEDLPVSVSIGLASLHPDWLADDWLKQADTALYHAKRAGKNQVATAGGSG